jgi:NADH-quinone oxidoreductase subunit G
MINGKGRLQRLNRAVRGPGQARDDWEILRDLIHACSDPNSETDSRGSGIYSIEDVFRQMSESIPQFAGLSLSKIGDLGVQVLNGETTPPPESTAARIETKILESEKARR